MRGIIIGTGPSLTTAAIEQIKRSSLPKFGCNLTFKALQLDALYINDREFWQHYGDELDEYDCPKWTYHKDIAAKHGAHYVEGVWAPGLSSDPRCLHWGHGSGYELIGVAYLLGIREFILIGYDLRYPKGYDGIKRVAGGDRHFFGEYPKELQHWTKFNIGPAGELNGLLDMYRTIDPSDCGIRIINCSPGTALDFFEIGRLEDFI